MRKTSRPCVNLGNAFKETGRLEEAISSYEKALLLRPEMPEAHYNLGTVYQDQCRMDEAVACFRKTLEFKPDHAVAHSNLLMNLQYDSDITPEELLQESQAWESLQLAGAAIMPPPSTTPDPERRLRIGYVSGDLRRHPVGYFLDGVLASHDREYFEIFCYANQSFGDDLTDRLRKNTNQWRTIFGWNDDSVAELIREDGIDILIDLSGHTARNRLLVFGRKPAPVQATWAGYVGTTGLSAMDYLISDPCETPEGTDLWYRESVVRLPDCYVCYTPPEYAPPVAPLPARKNGYLTFGCFNNLAKLNRPVMDLWLRLLHEFRMPAWCWQPKRWAIRQFAIGFDRFLPTAGSRIVSTFPAWFPTRNSWHGTEKWISPSTRFPIPEALPPWKVSGWGFRSLPLGETGSPPAIP